MSITPGPQQRGDDADMSHIELTTALRGLRDDARPRAVEIAHSVLERALRARRHTLPIRAHPPHHHVHVSDQVIRTLLRQRIDDDVQGAATGRIALLVDPDQTLREVTVELFVQYGEVLMDVADHARYTVQQTLDDLLSRPQTPVEIQLTHVHISDITVGDPGLEQPDEG